MYSKIFGMFRKGEKEPKEEKDYNTKEFVIKRGVLQKYRGKSAHVEIPDCVVEIGRNAFDRCKSAVSIVIPEGVIRIGNEAFEDCKNLQTISIPSTVISMGEEVFENCKSLTTIVIPRSVQYIGKEAFGGFRKNQTIIIEGGESQESGFSRSWISGCRAKIVYQA